MRVTRILMVFAVVSFLALSVAFAQDYPDKPVKVICPFSEGSATDVFARIVSKKLSEMWGQPVTVENVIGAGGTVGADAAAKSAPDGYTLLFNSAAHTTNPALYSKLPYDPQKDFVEIAPFATQPFVLVVGSSGGIKSVSELISMAKTKPGQIKFGSAGMGSGTHFCAEKFRLAAGIDVVHVPYKGGPEANAATISGEVTYWFPPLAMALKNVKDGKLLVLGVASAKRSGALPEAPTMAEAGVSLEDASWFGLWAPAGIPGGMKGKIAKDVAQAVASPDVLDQLKKLGAEPMSMSPAEFTKFVRSEMESAARTAKAAGIKPQ